MITISDKQQCCGCGACVQKCPKRCISLKEDNEGFLYPHADATTCIDCGICENVCPVLNPEGPRKPLQVLAAINKDEKIRMESSSGGIFTLLAEKVINEGGVVFGARFDDEWQVTLDYTETIEGLAAFRGSKYVQARTSEAYKQCERFLKNGRKVLFSGTPCQISGLKHFLHKEYDNLIAVDFVCHGVPSPTVWRKYLQEINASNIKSINFREKHGRNLSWRKFGLVIKVNDGFISSKSLMEDTYLRGFLGDLYLRPSCHECPAKAGKSGSNITIADYWGVHATLPKWDDNKGVSLLIINNGKGASFLKIIRSLLDYEEIGLEDIRTANESYFKSPKMPKASIKFWNQFTNMSLKENVDSCLYVPIWRRLIDDFCTYSTIALKKLTGRL